jgi:hypothetical protein
VNTCRFTIDHHPDTDQCGEDMITHAVHVEPINVTAPQWVLEGATRHMCADMVTEHGHFLPSIDPTIKVMAAKGLDTLVVLAPDYWDIDDAFETRGHSRVADRISKLHRALYRPVGHTAVVVNLGSGFITHATREQAWEAR